MPRLQARWVFKGQPDVGKAQCVLHQPGGQRALESVDLNAAIGRQRAAAATTSSGCVHVSRVELHVHNLHRRRHRRPCPRRHCRRHRPRSRAPTRTHAFPTRPRPTPPHRPSADPSQCHVSSNDRSGLSPLRFVLQNHLSSCGLVRHGQVMPPGWSTRSAAVGRSPSAISTAATRPGASPPATLVGWRLPVQFGECAHGAAGNTSTATACYKTDTTFDLYMPARTSPASARRTRHPPHRRPRRRRSRPAPSASAAWPAPADVDAHVSNMVSTNDPTTLIPRRVMTKDECEAYAAGIDCRSSILAWIRATLPRGVP